MAFNFWREVAAWIREQPFAAGYTVYHQNTPEIGTFITILGYSNGAPFGMSRIDRGIQIEPFQAVVQHSDEETARSTCEAIRQAVNGKMIPLDSADVMGYAGFGGTYRAAWTAKFQYRCNLTVEVPSYLYRE